MRLFIIEKVEADDYCANLHQDAVCRVLLLNRVTAGREFRTKLNSTHLVQPPRGYDSVSFRSYRSFLYLDDLAGSWRAWRAPEFRGNSRVQ